MATPFRVHLSPTTTGLLRYEHSQEESEKVSALLQEDLETHHVFFNASGFHNHIPHHLFTLYGTGASGQDIQNAYTYNAGYQCRARAPSPSRVQAFEADWANARAHLGNGDRYADFLRFFQDVMEQRGWQAVLNEYVFKENDERSRELFNRLFAGFLHPMIQLMYGVEFAQPAVVATGLSQAAVHKDKLGSFLIRAEEAADRRNVPMGTIESLLEEARRTKKLAQAARFSDSDKIGEGIMGRAPEEALDLTARVKVREDELEERTAEMFCTVAWMATAAAFHPPNIPKYDFYLMHHVNSAPFFLTINSFPWVPTSTKVRLLEWKIRMDILQYTARSCPPLRTEPIENYRPKDKTLVSKPEDLLPRFHRIPDDGHTIKLVRALLLARDLSKKYEGRPWVKIRSDEVWLRVFYMLLDGNEKMEPKWVRSAGFEEAWKEIPKVNESAL